MECRIGSPALFTARYREIPPVAVFNPGELRIDLEGAKSLYFIRPRAEPWDYQRWA